MYKVNVNNNSFDVMLKNELMQVNSLPFEWDISKINDRYYHIIKDSKSYRVEVVNIDPVKKSVILKINGNKYDVELKDKFDLLLEKLGMNIEASSHITAINAPMPGLIYEIHVSEGDEVKKGDPIMVLEAMKMENIIKAEGTGIVKSIKVRKGDSVEKNQVLVQF